MDERKRLVVGLWAAHFRNATGVKDRVGLHMIAGVLLRLAGLSFSAAIFFSSFRYRWTLFERPFPGVYGDYTDGLFFAGDIFLIAMLLFWLAGLALDQRKVSFGPLGLTIPLAGLALIAALSVPFSVLPMLSFYNLLRLTACIGLYLYVVNEVKGIASLILPAAASIAVQGAVAVGQWLAQSDLGLQRFGEYPLNPAWNGVSIVWAAAGRSLRAYGLSDHPNILGGLLAFALILLLTWYSADEAGQKGRPGRTLAAGVFVLGMAGLLLTFSRSAWIAFAAALAFGAGVLIWKRGGGMLLNGAALLGAALIVISPLIWRNLPYLGVRFGAGNSFQNVPYEQGSVGERLVLNNTANDIFAQHAVIGVGLGAYPVALSQAKPDFPVDYQPPHVVVLEAAAETGLFGAAFYSLAAVAPWLMLLLRRRRLAFSPELIGASALLLAVMVVGLFDYYPWLLAPGRFWAWLAWGLWAAMYLKEQSKDQTGLR